VSGAPHAQAGGGGPVPRSLGELFVVFAGLALRGFGGVLPFAQRVLVEERRWLGRDQFVEMLAYAQLLPGPNIVNLSLMVGDRWFGWRGSLAALGGLIGPPMAIVLVVGVLIGQVADDPLVRRVLTGMGAAAGGLILGTALKLVSGRRDPAAWLVFAALAFAGLALLRLPLVAVLAMLAPIAVAIAYVLGSRGGER
jgi:chromate transporter